MLMCTKWGITVYIKSERIKDKMNNGFVKVAAATPKIKVGDCGYNGAQICKIIDEVYDNGAQLVVFPELCITGYTCSDLFWQKSMLDIYCRALRR